jgi:hypothetical protein
MAYIKEPKGVDFTVESSVLKKEDLKQISEAISAYKKKGKALSDFMTKAISARHVDAATVSTKSGRAVVAQHSTNL